MADTDRELLELAAKAAGIALDFESDPWGRARLVSDGVVTAVWNPLTDDGDALRLAVKLEMDILQRRSDPEVWAQAPMMRTICEPVGADRQAATRRAIVRAAAEIERAAP